jgi:hypothetical protein
MQYSIQVNKASNGNVANDGTTMPVARTWAKEKGYLGKKEFIETST